MKTIVRKPSRMYNLIANMFSNRNALPKLPKQNKQYLTVRKRVRGFNLMPPKNKKKYESHHEQVDRPWPELSNNTI